MYGCMDVWMHVPYPQFISIESSIVKPMPPLYPVALIDDYYEFRYDA